jgi:protein-disulfide isomerase
VGRRTLAGLVAIAVTLGLAACAPAVPGVPGSVPVVEEAPQAPSQNQSPDISAPIAPGPAAPSEPTSAVDGAIAIGDGAMQVDVWVDFFCPYCRMFDEANGDTLAALIEDGSVTLRVHPIAFLDRLSMGTRYSTRAANAFLCVAETSPDDAYAFYRHLYAIQPEEGTEGLSDEELASAAPTAAADCISGEWFGDWVGEWTQHALDDGVNSTPTVVVDGRPFPGGFDPIEFRDFLLPSGSIV